MVKSFKKIDQVSKIFAYDLIKKPIVTEKSSLLSENNQVIFEVKVTATKLEIKKAIESLYSVKVKAVNTIRVKGKVKRFRGIVGKRAEIKKAIVSLADGQSIDINAGF
tara:strand:+ start:407 stop:730 length:324 start_codon:yes stop_codon:yes gene_type:complete